MGFIVNDSVTLTANDLALSGFVISIRNNYRVMKNNGVTTVEFTCHYYASINAYNNNFQTVLSQMNTLVVPVETTDIISFIYTTLKANYANTTDN